MSEAIGDVPRRRLGDRDRGRGRRRHARSERAGQASAPARAAPGDQPGAMATELNGFTNGSGVVTFQNVPVGAFVATGEAAALGGISNGDARDARPGRRDDGSPWPLRQRRGPRAARRMARLRPHRRS